MNDMLKYDIEDAIKKNLSQEVGLALTEELEELEKYRNQLPKLQDQLRDKEEEIGRLKELAGRQSGRLAAHANLDDREKAMGVRERQAENERLKHELATSKEFATHCRDVAMGLVRNTEYRRRRAYGVEYETQYSQDGGSTTIPHVTQDDQGTAE